MLATETEQSLSRFPQYCKNIAFAHVLAVLGKRLDQEPTGSGDQQELLMAGLYLNEPHAANVYGEGPQKEHGQDACNQGQAEPKTQRIHGGNLSKLAKRLA